MRVLPYLWHVYPTCITEDMNIHEHTEARTRNMRKRTLALFFEAVGHPKVCVSK